MNLDRRVSNIRIFICCLMAIFFLLPSSWLFAQAKVNFEDIVPVMKDKVQLLGTLAWKPIGEPKTAVFSHTVDLLYPQGFWQLLRTKEGSVSGIEQPIRKFVAKGTPVTFVFYANPQWMDNAQVRLCLKKAKAPYTTLWSQVVKIDSSDSGWRDHYYRYSFPAPEMKPDEVLVSISLVAPTAKTQIGACWFYVVGDKDPLFDPAAKTDENIIRVKAKKALSADEIEKRIDRFRKGKITVSVIDQNGSPVADASVKMRLLRPDFTFACALSPEQIAEPQFAQSKSAKAIQNFFNVVVLEADWAKIEKSKGNFDFSELDRSVAWIKQSGMTAIVSLWHPDQAPPAWLASSKSSTGNAIRTYVSKVIAHFANQTDIFQYSLDQPKAIGAWVGQSTPNAAAEKLIAWSHFAGVAEKTKLIVRVDDVGKIKFVFDLLSRSGSAQSLLSTSVALVSPHENDVDAWLAMQELKPLNTDLYLAGWIETAKEAELNDKEIVQLRKTCQTIFSHPSARGIVFPNPLDDAVLVSTKGATTALNKELTSLIKGKWSGSFTGETDRAGTVTTRDFYGNYEISVDDHHGHTSKTQSSLSPADPGASTVSITLRR